MTNYTQQLEIELEAIKKLIHRFIYAQNPKECLQAQRDLKGVIEHDKKHATK